MLAGDEASRALGIELIDLDEGRAVTRTGTPSPTAG